jgi:hypothetical protein
MTEKHCHLKDKHTHIFASLSKDTKQKIIHHHRIDGFDEGALRSFYDLPVEVVWAILVHKQYTLPGGLLHEGKRKRPGADRAFGPTVRENTEP